MSRTTPPPRQWGHQLALPAAAIGFACATGYNSLVAIREAVPGKPFGVRPPFSVTRGILVGWGSAVAAPWPMPVAAVFAAIRRSGRLGAARAAIVCACIGGAGIVGILIEPNTYTMGSWTPPIRRAVFAHVATSAALAMAGISSLRDARRP